jgi:thiol:disulfide interchange protein DsbA
VKAWKAELPEDVAFVQTPAVWNRMMQLHAHLFYAAKDLGVFDALHDGFFHALQEERNPLTDPAEIVERFAAAGAPREAVMAAVESPSVMTRVRDAAQAMQAAGLQGVPGLVVAGKYRIGAAEAGSQEAMLEIADFLIEQERAAPGGAE